MAHQKRKEQEVVQEAWAEWRAVLKAAREEARDRKQRDLLAHMATDTEKVASFLKRLVSADGCGLLFCMRDPQNPCRSLVGIADVLDGAIHQGPGSLIYIKGITFESKLT